MFCQAPLALSTLDEPEPDVVVVPSGDYRTRLPDRALLVVEVADATITRELGRKARLQARAGIPEYWVVDLRGRQIGVHLDPDGDSWRSVVARGPDEVISPQAFPQLRTRVGSLLP